MTLDILHEQGDVKVGTEISPTPGSMKYLGNFVGAKIIVIRRWMVTVSLPGGGIAKIYRLDRGILDRRYLMSSFKILEGVDAT